jgi:hypothetical protein
MGTDFEARISPDVAYGKTRSAFGEGRAERERCHHAGPEHKQPQAVVKALETAGW